MRSMQLNVKWNTKNNSGCDNATDAKCDYETYANRFKLEQSKVYQVDGYFKQFNIENNYPNVKSNY